MLKNNAKQKQDSLFTNGYTRTHKQQKPGWRKACYVPVSTYSASCGLLLYSIVLCSEYPATPKINSGVESVPKPTGKKYPTKPWNFVEKVPQRLYYKTAKPITAERNTGFPVFGRLWQAVLCFPKECLSSCLRIKKWLMLGLLGWLCFKSFSEQEGPLHVS